MAVWDVFLALGGQGCFDCIFGVMEIRNMQQSANTVICLSFPVTCGYPPPPRLPWPPVAFRGLPWLSVKVFGIIFDMSVGCPGVPDLLVKYGRLGRFPGPGRPGVLWGYFWCCGNQKYAKKCRYCTTVELSGDLWIS